MSKDFEKAYNLVERLADLMKEKGLHSLDIDIEEDVSISLTREKPMKQHVSRGGDNLIAQQALSLDAERSSHFDGGYTNTSENFELTNIYTDPSIKIIDSPMVGVFYAASSPDVEPFVKVGDTINTGDVLCIIEAMKLMNEIVAEFDCIIEEVCVPNEQVVDVGMSLFRVKEL